MRNVLKKTPAWLTFSFWAAVLLILPNCGFTAGSIGPGRNLPLGDLPRDAAIFCDIEKVFGRHCATALDLQMGIRLSEAAVALAEGQTSNVGLDDSPAALARCGGKPEAVLFEGSFPRGLPVCLNCSSIATNFAGDNNAACQAACYDLFGPVDSLGNKIPENPPDPLVVSFCAARARASTNFPATGCFANACNEEGFVRDVFADPRRLPEAVIWDDLVGATAGGGSGSDLTRTAPLTGQFDAGAVSRQWITRGDAYVEYAASRNDQSHLLGLSSIPAGCAPPCADTNQNYTTIGFTLGLGNDGLLRIFHSGVQIIGPGPSGTFGTYAAEERFRVRARDNGNGTATISYARVIGGCVPGTACAQSVVYTHTAGTAAYPLRVDTSLYELGATLVDVQMVRVR